MAKSASKAAEGLDTSMPIAEQAFFWIAYLESGEATDEDYEALEAWIEKDSQHGPALHEARRLWQETGAALSLPAREPLSPPLIRTAPANRRSPRAQARWIAGAGLLAACLGIGLFMMPFMDRAPQPPAATTYMAARYSTAIAEVRRFALEDGSEIVLAGDSAVEITFRDNSREAVLLQGQAFFEVAPAPARPFSVAAGPASVTVLGTAFDVRRGPSQTTVSVVSGTVSVRASEAASPQVLTVGQRLSVDKNGRFGPVQRFEPNQVLSWQELRFSFEDSRLEDLIADLNRYSQPRIELADPSLRDINVSASFSLDQSDAMLASLAAALSLELVEEDGRRILRKPD